MVALMKHDNRILDTIIQGDCLNVLRTLETCSVDAIVTDPPAGISFMGKDWDANKGSRDIWINWLSQIMAECLRVLKPGGHALVWALPRTSHWTATAIEDAGFEIRDVLTHITGQGFPKSLDVTKAVKSTGEYCQCQRDVLYYEEKGVYHVSTSLQTNSDLPELQSAVLSKESQDVESMPFLFSQVLRGVESGQSRDTRTTQEDSPNRTGGLVGRDQGTIPTQEHGRKQPILERRGDFLQEEGQLYGGEICSLSTGVSNDGSQGRLCDGTSASDGSTSREMFKACGSGTSQRSQSKQQRYQQSSVIPQQCSPQTCRSCGKTIVPSGLGTALKPASENWILCRKPLSEKSIAAQYLATGTATLNIDACRISHNEPLKTTERTAPRYSGTTMNNGVRGGIQSTVASADPQGRFPSNLLLSHSWLCTDSLCDEQCPIRLLDEQSGILHARGNKTLTKQGSFFASQGKSDYLSPVNPGDTGGASRYFTQFCYTAKASKRERGENNTHPTVKSLSLMSWLCRLITPPNGIVLDCFAGSGSTLVAAIQEGFHYIGIEAEQEYIEIARARVAHALQEVAV